MIRVWWPWCLIDEPEVNVYGGVVAAPVFRNIAQGALRRLAVAPRKGSADSDEQDQSELPSRRRVKQPGAVIGRSECGSDARLRRLESARSVGEGAELESEIAACRATVT